MRHFAAFAVFIVAQQSAAQTLSVGALPGDFQHYGNAMQACADMGLRAELRLPSVSVESYDVIVDEEDWSRVSSRSTANPGGPLLSSTLSMSDTTANSFSCMFEVEGSAEDAGLAWNVLTGALQEMSETGEVTAKSFQLSADFVGFEYCTEVVGVDQPTVAIVNVSHVRDSETSISTVVSILTEATGGATQVCWVDEG